MSGAPGMTINTGRLEAKVQRRYTQKMETAENAGTSLCLCMVEVSTCMFWEYTIVDSALL